MARKRLGKKTFHFTAPPELIAKLDKLAARRSSTRSDLIAAIVREFLEKAK